MPPALPTALRPLVEAAPGYAVVTSADAPRFTVVAINDAYLAVRGGAAADVIGRSLFEVEAPVDASLDDDLRASLERVLSTGLPATVARRARGPGGPGTPWWRWTTVPLLGPDGSVDQLVLHASDVSDLVAAEAGRDQALARGDRDRFLAEATELLISSLDPATILRRFADFSVPRLGDFCFFDVVTDDGRIQRAAWAHADPAMQAHFDRVLIMVPDQAYKDHPVAGALDSGEPILVPDIDEAWMRRAATSPDHLAFMRSLSLHSLLTIPLTSGERRLGALTFCYGESHRAHGDEELHLAVELGHRATIALLHTLLFEEAQSARREAEEASRAKSEFLSAMSHELRTPLNAISGYVELLSMGLHGALNAAQRQALDRVNVNQRHLLELISDILSFSSLETGRVRFHIEPVEAAAVLASVDVLVTSLGRGGEGVWEILPCEAGVHCLADQERLRQILLSLVRNAFKFSPEGGRVTLSCEHDDGSVCFQVQDEGPGIAPTDRETIFDPFVQLGRRLDQPRDGIGLGLSISRELARGMEGTLTVTSTLGRGSLFTVGLPRA